MHMEDSKSRDCEEVLLNEMSKIFHSKCEPQLFLLVSRVEFIGAPGQPGPDGETVDPSSFTPEYLQALQRCATQSNILESFSSFSEAQENLTPEDITELNFGIPVFGECLERLGWEVGEIIPDERGALGFGTNGQGLTPPADAEGIFPSGDIQTCRQEAQTYFDENYVAEE